MMGGACQREWLHGVPTRVHRSPADLTDLAMDEPSRTAGHQPDLLRRPPLQRRTTPARIAEPTRLTLSEWPVVPGP